MKKLLGKGKVIVSFVSVFAILAVSLLSVFVGTGFTASAENETDEQAVSYPINGTYDADVTILEGGISYEAIDPAVKKDVSRFDGFATDFLENAEGRGTAREPYIIKTANEFAAVATGRVTTAGLHFKVADNVAAFDMNNTETYVDLSGDKTASEIEALLSGAKYASGLNWNCASPFEGFFDGNGVVVYGLFAIDEDDAGMFPQYKGNVSIRNLTVKNCCFTGLAASVFIGRSFGNGNPKLVFQNCSAYNNVVIASWQGKDDEDSDNAIIRGGILTGIVVNESSLEAENCLVYGNIAKHATFNITYGLVTWLHHVKSATLTDCIIMDSAPHALYYGSNAFHRSLYTNVYTNAIGTSWENITPSRKYTYNYAYNDVTGVVNAEFAKLKLDDSFDMGSSVEPYKRTFANGCFILTDEATVKKGDELKGIDSAKWTYSANSYPTPKIYKVREYSAGDAWSGETAVMFTAGEGTSASPYQIATAEELALMLLTAKEGQYFELTSDIVLNDTSVANWTDNAKQWFTSNDVPTFAASLNGNGYTVSGLYYGGSQKGEYSGLIPVVGSGADIRELKVINSSLTAKSGAIGAIAGAVAERCGKVVNFNADVADETVVFGGNAASGGIIGKIGYSAVNINDCLSAANGLFGDITGVAKVNRCISANAYPFGKTTNVTAKNVYTDVSGDELVYTDTDGKQVAGVTVLTTEQLKPSKSADAKADMPGLNFPDSWKVVKGDFPRPSGLVLASNGVKGEVWSGAVASKFAGGDGSKDKPYLIETAEQLAHCIKDNTSGTATSPKYYKLTADIYLNDVNSPLWADKIGCNEWYTQRTANYDNFHYTTFDGDGYVIYGLYLDHSAGDTYVRAGFIPQSGIGTVIENVGFSNAYLVGNTSIEGESIGIVTGMIGYWNTAYPMDPHDLAKNNTYRETEGFKAEQPKIRNCFVDHTCYVKADDSGGFVGAAGGPVLFENCIFTGSVDYSAEPTSAGTKAHFGTFVGQDHSYGSAIKNCVSLPQSGTRVMSGGTVSSWRQSAENYVLDASNVYYFAFEKQPGVDSNKVIKLNKPTQRIGEAAKKAMSGLDWEETVGDGGIWRVVEGGTPVLAKFGEHRTQEELEKFSDFNFTAPSTTVTFVTNVDGLEVDPITGPMYSTMTLPTVEREGYKFTGWYVFDDISVEYPYDYYPPRNLTLYAGWEPTGVIQGFESYPDTIWDYDETQWRLNKPGAKGGYKNAYVRTGGRSMRLLDTNTEPVDVLLNYQDMLEPGQTYKIILWATTDKANNPDTLLSLVHNSKPVYLDTAVAYENMTVASGLKVGEWTKYTYTFTAQTKWVSLRADGANSSLYFDDIMIVPVNDTVSGGNLIHLNSSSNSPISPNTGDIVTVTALISAIMACAVVAVISRKNSVEVID